MRLIPYVRRSELPTTTRLIPEISRVFDDLFDGSTRSDWISPNAQNWVPAVDIMEKDGNLVLRAELPGMNEKDIQLKLEGNILTITGERKHEKEEKEENFYRMERTYGSFSRSFTLPDTIAPDQIKAEYKNGVLSVTIPQKPEAKPREIPVSVS